MKPLTCSCTASELTLGTCLPGKYFLKYSVTNSAGLKSSAFLDISVEQYSVNTFSYTFSPARNKTKQTAVQAFALSILNNATLAATLAAKQLPAFGVNASSIRSVFVNSSTVQAGPTLNGTATYVVSIQLTVILVRVLANCGLDPAPMSKLMHPMAR